jgi:hypothetical protein
MKFGVPLSVPGSRYVERCYAEHGKGHVHTPPRDAAIELVLIDESRRLWNVPSHYGDGHRYLTDAVQVECGWRILGWRMADGSMPFGEYDEVDPELAQMDYLPAPSPPESRHGSLRGASPSWTDSPRRSADISAPKCASGADWTARSRPGANRSSC